ncbi:hypothetical protein ACHWQZ_G018961 [Mnemiopsis leidyi]
MSKLLHFCAEEVTRLFPPFLVHLEALKETMIEYSVKESIVQPVRQQLTVPNTADRFISMPACVPSRGVMGIKVICAVPSNKEKCLPTHLGCIQLYGLTGELLCQMDAEEITAKRTAICSALASKALANPDSKILAVIGAGVQAESHIQALSQLFNFSEIRVWNRTKSRAEKLVRELHDVGNFNLCVSDTVGSACSDADIVCTVTSSSEPVLFKDHVKPGAHVNVVGASSPTTREVGDDLMLSDNLVIVADCLNAIKLESGDVIQSGAAPHHELGHVLHFPLSRDPDQITLFKNLGLACQDVVTAHLIYKQYLSESTRS